MGLTPVSYCVGAEFLVPRARQRAVIDQVKREVDVAAELGVPSMRHDVTRGFTAYRGYRGAKTFVAALKIVVPGIREIADYDQSHGVMTSVENHGFYMQASERVERLIKEVDHDSFALTMDMGNFLCVNEDPVAAVRRLLKYTVHVHVKDFHIKPKKLAPPEGWFDTPTPIALRGAIVGHGNVNVPEPLRLLAGSGGSGYRGYLSLEFEGLEEPTEAIAMGLGYLHRELKTQRARVGK